MLPQVPGDQDIADFLSALEEASTAAPGGLYAAALPPAPEEGSGALAAGAAAAADGQPAEAAGGKVQAVCAAVRAALARRDKVRAIGGGCSVCPGLAAACRWRGTLLLAHPAPACHAPLPQAAYLRAVLTSHAKCGQLEAALLLVKAAKEAALAVGGGGCQPADLFCRGSWLG